MSERFFISRPQSTQMSLSRPQTVAEPTRLNTARSRTGQSRPVTARPDTAHHEASFVVAIIEGRGAAPQVGLAALDKDTGRVFLAQVGHLHSGFWNNFDRMLLYVTGRRLSDLRQNAPSNAFTYSCSCLSA